MKKIFRYGQVLIAFLKLMKDPNKTELIAKFCEHMADVGWFKESLNYLKADPKTAETFSLRPRLPVFDPAALSKMPEGTLGAVFGKFLLQNNFDPNYFRIHPDINDTYYILIRSAETHDLCHMVTGFTTDVPGELGLQAFMLRQQRMPQNIIFLAGGLIRTFFKEPAKLSTCMDEICRGWQMSKQYSSVFSADWMSLMDKPLTEVIQSFKKEAFRGVSAEAISSTAGLSVASL